MIDFHDPTIQVETATTSTSVEIPLVDPATSRRFRHLDQAGATAYLDRLGSGEQMMPSAALSAAEASIPRDGARQVAVQPRRGPAFLIPLHRGRQGLVYAQSWT